MTDAEWAVVRDMIPVPVGGEGRGGRPEKYCHRDILDAIRYVVDNGVKWPVLPVDYLLWKVSFPRDAELCNRGSDGSHKRRSDHGCTEEILVGVA
ncbi:transposase [Streptomyces sp. JNUCC 63]